MQEPRLNVVAPWVQGQHAKRLLCAVPLLLGVMLRAQTLVPLPQDSYFAPYKVHLAPPVEGLVLKEGDRLAICGDSITEQKMYSRIMETYLTVCVPELRITVRQFGWSGERAPGFHSRMTNDVLRFHPTVATTCYGMNDHRYRTYTDEIGAEYEESSRQIIEAFQSRGVRVIQGSAGTVGKIPRWVNNGEFSVQDMNLGLLELRNTDVRLAREYKVGFADVYLPMLVQGKAAQDRYGQDYLIPGKDGVHPGWAGHVVMAYAFLKAMGLDGDLGSITLDLADGSGTVTGGHDLISSKDGTLELISHQYPYVLEGELGNDGSARSGAEWVPFFEDLNRFILKIQHPKAQRYRVIWGSHEQTFASSELQSGVNLAQAFEKNPFSESFHKVDEAVAAKQAYETRQIKQIFHGPEGQADAEMAAALTEKVRAPLADAVRKAFQPVRHTLQVLAE